MEKPIKIKLKGKNGFAWMGEIRKYIGAFWNWEVRDLDVHIYKKNGEWICEIKRL